MMTAPDPIPAPRERPSPDAPARRCVATRATAPKAGLIRFVVGPTGEIVPDLAERLPGRGLWLAAEGKAFAIAVAKNPFAKAARRAVRVPADLAERVEALLLRRCIDALGLARRAGAATIGAERLRAAAGRIALLLVASDGAGDRTPRGTPVSAALTAAELGAAFDRPAVAAAAIAPGRIAESLTRDAARLAGLRARPRRPEPPNAP
jgi:hypothetical protein